MLAFAPVFCWVTLSAQTARMQCSRTICMHGGQIRVRPGSSAHPPRHPHLPPQHVLPSTGGLPSTPQGLCCWAMEKACVLRLSAATGAARRALPHPTGALLHMIPKATPAPPLCRSCSCPPEAHQATHLPRCMHPLMVVSQQLLLEPQQQQRQLGRHLRKQLQEQLCHR